ncbi:hypothetical protein [Inquilinus limosus]|uniref:Uncharacterized protein n=1 Tax=Inquilinus limosus TaxID=171674 RepID=A0A211YUD5_9PROT|nr:hypothetical protein [Inquilinus limosus]OWJ56622.1 hypothetical protein BWR60_34805 [Inquilinus limosus]
MPALAALAVLATAGPAMAHHKPWHHGGPPWARPHHGYGYYYARPRPPVVIYERPHYGYYGRPYYYRRPAPVYVEPPPYYYAPAPGVTINIPLRFD